MPDERPTADRRAPRAAAGEPGVPLAERLRPRTLGEVIGQSHLLAEGKPLRTAFESGRLHSMILRARPASARRRWHG